MITTFLQILLRKIYYDSRKGYGNIYHLKQTQKVRVKIAKGTDSIKIRAKKQPVCQSAVFFRWFSLTIRYRKIKNHHSNVVVADTNIERKTVPVRQPARLTC